MSVPHPVSMPSEANAKYYIKYLDQERRQAEHERQQLQQQVKELQKDAFLLKEGFVLLKQDLDLFKSKTTESMHTVIQLLHNLAASEKDK